MDGFIYGEVVNILGSDGDNSVKDSSYVATSCGIIFSFFAYISLVFVPQA